MSKPVRTPEDLLDFIATESTIKCNKCKGGASTYADSYDSLDEFFHLGWRATKDNVYCPKCAIKYLKHI